MTNAKFKQEVWVLKDQQTKDKNECGNTNICIFCKEHDKCVGVCVGDKVTVRDKFGDWEGTITRINKVTYTIFCPGGWNARVRKYLIK